MCLQRHKFKKSLYKTFVGPGEAAAASTVTLQLLPFPFDAGPPGHGKQGRQTGADLPSFQDESLPARWGRSSLGLGPLALSPAELPPLPLSLLPPLPPATTSGFPSAQVSQWTDFELGGFMVPAAPPCF